MKSSDIISEYLDRYSEYIEMLGDNFPEFLITKLATDLAKERSHSQFLEKVRHDSTRH